MGLLLKNVENLYKSKVSLKYFFPLFFLFLSACSIKNYEFSESKVITIKTAKLKFSDLGYLKQSADAVRLELFVAGKNVQNISINHLICVDDGCMGKKSFNEEFLSASYPDEILQNIILGRYIFDAKGVVKTTTGFEQNIVTKNLDIKYRVTDKEIYFKDKKNRILFKIKDINNGN